jgi:hypothetical protein
VSSCDGALCTRYACCAVATAVAQTQPMVRHASVPTFGGAEGRPSVRGDCACGHGPFLRAHHPHSGRAGLRQIGAELKRRGIKPRNIMSDEWRCCPSAARAAVCREVRCTASGAWRRRLAGQRWCCTDCIGAATPATRGCITTPTASAKLSAPACCSRCDVDANSSADDGAVAEPLHLRRRAGDGPLHRCPTPGHAGGRRDWPRDPLPGCWRAGATAAERPRPNGQLSRHRPSCDAQCLLRGAPACGVVHQRWHPLPLPPRWPTLETSRPWITTAMNSNDCREAACGEPSNELP